MRRLGHPSESPSCLSRSRNRFGLVNTLDGALSGPSEGSLGFLLAEAPFTKKDESWGRIGIDGSN